MTKFCSLSQLPITNYQTSITVSVPGTCGELIQGWYAPWNEAVLVSCPIERYSKVTVRLESSPYIDTPPGCVKMRQVARLLLDVLGRPDLGATIRLQSQLKIGRGMASSTADIVGTMMGLTEALGQSLSPRELARLACQVEPSDSVMFDGLAVLAYRGSARTQHLGSVPPLPCLVLDPGQTIDTLAYNAKLNISAVRKLASTTQSALTMLHQGLVANNFAAIGQAATLSATSYQAVNYNALLPEAQRWAKETGALGLVRAHSGSIIGLLYPPGAPLQEPTDWLSPRFNGRLLQTRLTNGSCQLDKHSTPDHALLFDKAYGLC